MKTGCEPRSSGRKRSIELPVIPNAGPAAIAHSKTSRWRAAVLITLTILMGIHLIQWWLTGSTVSPIEPSEAMYTIQNGAVNAGMIFFSLALAATLIFGRFVCGWGCHIVALQDLCGWMMKRIGIRPKPFRSRLLIFVPLIVALYMFVWPSVYGLLAAAPGQQIIPQFTNHLVTTEFWRTFPPVGVAIPFLFICGFMTVYFLGAKGFCTYACPYGGFFGVLDKFAPGRIRVTDACNECGHCTTVCTSNVLVHTEVKEFGMVVDPGCMKCMDCVSVCPNDALYFGFGKPAVLTRSASRRSFSLSWPEEIVAAVVFFLSFLAVWDVYQLVPMFMALGWASVSTFLVITCAKYIRSSEVRFFRSSLKRSGHVTAYGAVFLVFAVLWIGLTLHSGWIRYHERAGTIAFQNLQVPDELALARTDAVEWLSQSDRKNVNQGIYHFRTAAKRGLFTNAEAVSKAAWLEYLAGETDEALRLLEKASEVQSGETRALSLYYRGAILNRLRRYDEAGSSLKKALKERPDLTLANEELGESMWQLGQRKEAVDLWTSAVEQNPNIVVANYQLAGAAASVGDTEGAAEYEKRGSDATPSDPYFHWMLGMRLQNIGMNQLAERQYQLAIQLDPSFIMRRDRR
jgi:NAD-dependent dihydropyrimidine dehydrogenase PreA subunit/Tfp pilus assembly protein PilF